MNLNMIKVYSKKNKMLLHMVFRKKDFTAKRQNICDENVSRQNIPDENTLQNMSDKNI